MLKTLRVAYDAGPALNGHLPDVDPCSCLLFEEHLSYCARTATRGHGERHRSNGQMRLPLVARRRSR